MNQPAMTARQEWRRGWALVLAASIGFSFHSVMAPASGVFMGPLSDEFGWSRTEASSGVSVAGIISAVLSPFFGILIDRWGTRKIALPGLVITALAIASLGLNTGSITLWLSLWIVYGLVSMSVKSTIWSTAIAGAFESARGLALGIAFAGTAVSQTITPPLANWLIAEVGWREAFMWLGLAWGTFAFLICLPFLRDFHLQKSDGSQSEPRSRQDIPGLSVAEAWRDTALWRIGLSTFIMMALTIGLLVHQFPILVESGVSRTNAAWLASLAGIAGIIGKLVTGALLDRYAPNWIGGITLASGAFAFLLLLEPFRSPTLIVVAMIINGYASGSKLQICGYLTTRFAGLRNFGKIFGMMAALIAAGSGVGPVFAGWLYDLTGEYTTFLWTGTAGALLSGLLILSMPRYPVPTSIEPSVT